MALETIDFDHDHLHIMVGISPQYSVADVMAKLKSQSASQLRNQFCLVKEGLWKKNIVWSTGYFVSSMGVDEGIIKHYGEHQRAQDSVHLRMQL